MKTLFIVSTLVTSSLSFAYAHKSINRSKNQVIVKFKNAKHAEEFMSFMDGQGEQTAATWMSHNLPELDKMPKYDFENNIIDYSKK